LICSPLVFLCAFQTQSHLYIYFFLSLLFHSHFTVYHLNPFIPLTTCFPSLVTLQGGSTAGMHYMIWTSAMYFKQIKKAWKQMLFLLPYSTINPAFVHYFNISFHSFNLCTLLWCTPIFVQSFPHSNVVCIFILFFSLEFFCRRFIFWFQSFFHFYLQTGMSQPAWLPPSFSSLIPPPGISLLPTTYKILSNILLSRLIPYAEEVIGDHQCGFRCNRSTTDHIFCIDRKSVV
jgi:hypothetical protein